MNYEVIFEVERGCGDRQEGGVYLTGGRNRSAEGVLDPFTVLDPPIPYPTAFHRGPRLVESYAVLSRAPLANWWVGSSASTEITKRGWKLDERVFGMPLQKRLKTGVCAGAPNEESAVQALLNAVNPSTYQVASAILKMTECGLNEVTTLAGEFDTLVTMAQQKDDYVEGVAACWRMWYKAPPSKRAEVNACMAVMLVALGLLKDAIAMRKEL